MGTRGPKAIDVERLKSQAITWAKFLYMLRDGQPGLANKVEGDWIGDVPADRTHRAVKIIPANRKQARRFMDAIREIKNRGWIVFPPVFGNPRAWERWNRARTVEEIRRSADSIRRWARSVDPLGVIPGASLFGDVFPRVIHARAPELFRAMRMPNYPLDPSTNDDKRIIFFAKVLAGLTSGLAPATATKRLSHWRFPKDRVEKSYKELSERYPMPIGKGAQKEKTK